MKDKLHLGCGFDKMEGYVNIDIAPKVEPDIIVDVENGLPFPDNSFIEIFSCNTLEHIRPDKWNFVLNEMARVSKNNCLWNLILPFDNTWNRTNVHHYRTFNFSSFAQLTESTNREYYETWKLKDITQYPRRVVRLFYILFPFFKKEIEYSFLLIKK